MEAIVKNLSTYRNLWIAGHSPLAGEEIFKVLLEQVVQLNNQNERRKQEILQLKERGKT